MRSESKGISRIHWSSNTQVPCVWSCMNSKQKCNVRRIPRNVWSIVLARNAFEFLLERAMCSECEGILSRKCHALGMKGIPRESAMCLTSIGFFDARVTYAHNPGISLSIRIRTRKCHVLRIPKNLFREVTCARHL